MITWVMEIAECIADRTTSVMMGDSTDERSFWQTLFGGVLMFLIVAGGLYLYIWLG